MNEHRSISIADQIFDQLEKDILSGKYQRGEVLSELRLSKELGVSRTPIREALLRLEQENLIVENGRGMTVIGISKDDMVDMYDARMRLEGEAARRAARVITDDQINELRELIDLQLYYIDKNATKYSEKIKNLDSQFHQLLYSCCGSKTYTDILVALHKKMTQFRIASVSVQSRALQSNREHQAICDALATHDEDLAENATLEHVAHARERMLSMETMD